MSSKWSFGFVKLLVVALAVAGAFAGTASAQYLKGTFTLPYEVSWQGTVLPPGDYSITMNTYNSPALVSHASGRGVRMVLARCVDQARKGAPTALFLTVQGRERTVRLFNWRAGNTSFFYEPFTRAERETLARVDRMETVPIRMASK